MRRSGWNSSGMSWRSAFPFIFLALIRGAAFRESLTARFAPSTRQWSAPRTLLNLDLWALTAITCG